MLKGGKLFKITFLLLIFLNLNCAHSQNLVDGTFGKGIKILAKDSSFLVKSAFRFQTLYSGNLNLETDEWQESMMVRRCRLKFDGYAVSPKIKYKLELGFSNRDTRGGRLDESGKTANIILDAVIKWGFAPNWSLWFGQTKLPGNRERVISSQKLQFVDRSLVNSRFNLDRDIGLQLHHKSRFGSFIMKQSLAISTGEGRDIIVVNYNSGKQYTARIELLPFGEFLAKGDYFGSDLMREPTPKLSIGISGDYNNDAVRSRGNLGSFITEGADNQYVASDLATFFVDGMFKYKGLSALFEYAYRDSNSKVSGFGYGEGITVSSGYLLPGDFEIAGRFTSIQPNSDLSSIEDRDEYMVGFSKYVRGHSLKIQSDLSYNTIAGKDDFLMFRIQTEVAL